jgi:hypothetical protein
VIRWNSLLRRYIAVQLRLLKVVSTHLMCFLGLPRGIIYHNSV